MAALFLLALVVTSAAALEWENEETVSLDSMTQRIEIRDSKTEYLIKYDECPTSSYCFKTVTIEEMSCRPNTTSTDPTYIAFSAWDAHGQKMEKLPGICQMITKNDPLVIAKGLLPAELRIQPLGSDWLDQAGTATATIVVKAQVREVGKEEDSGPGYSPQPGIEYEFAQDFRQLQREIIYMEDFFLNTFMFSSGLTILLVILLLSFFTLQMNKIYKKIVRETAESQQRRNTNISAPPSYDVSYQKSQG